MKKIFILGILTVVSCVQKQEVYAPVGSTAEKNNISVSQERAKKLNEMERRQIQKWISKQNSKFYEMPMNYWVNIENLKSRPPKSSDENISYMFDLYDFAGTKLNDQPKGYLDVNFRKFPNEIPAVEDALKYLKTNEEATLLVPSVLAYGTFGDGNKIANDFPLIIKLKIIK